MDLNTDSAFLLFTFSLLGAKLRFYFTYGFALGLLCLLNMAYENIIPNFAVYSKNPPMAFFLKRSILICCSLLLFAAISLPAQDTIKAPRKQKNRDFLSRIDLGGYLGAQFGTVTLIEVSPIATYRVTNKFHTGFGLTYQYYKNNYYTPAYSTSSYGVSLFSRYFIWRDLFAHVEYAPLYINYYDYYDNGAGGYTRVKGATWVHDFMIGGGYRQIVGSKAYISMMILWNINETYYSPYRNPIIRIGFGVGL
jgi:hypothetical protein